MMADINGMAQYITEPGNEEGQLDKERAASGEQYGAKGRPAPHPVGIVYRGPYEPLYDGVAAAVRRHAVALRRTGIPVFLQSLNYRYFGPDGTVQTTMFGELDPEVQAEVGTITSPTHRSTALTIHHVTPASETIEGIIRPRFLASTDPAAIDRLRVSSIIFSAFERNLIGRDLASMLSRVGSVWVPCSANKVALEKSGVRCPVHVVPHPHSDDDPILRVRRVRRSGPIRLLHVGKWEPRKDQHTLVGGFLLGFEPQSNVQLVIKMREWGKWKNWYNNPGDSLRYWLRQGDVRARGWTEENVTGRIRFVPQLVDRATLIRIYEESDIYVSSGHGEGFDLPAYDAKLSGMRMVYCPNTGPRDLATEGDVTIRVHPAPCFAQYGWEPGAMWDGYGTQDMADALREAVARHEAGLPTAALDRSGFTMDGVGKRMRALCGEQVKHWGGNIDEVNVDA